MKYINNKHNTSLVYLTFAFSIFFTVVILKMAFNIRNSAGLNVEVFTYSCVAIYIAYGYSLWMRNKIFFLISSYYYYSNFSILLGLALFENRACSSELLICGSLNLSTLIFLLLFVIFFEGGNFISIYINKGIHPSEDKVNHNRSWSILVKIIVLIAVYIIYIFFNVGVADFGRGDYMRLTDSYRFENIMTILTYAVCTLFCYSVFQSHKNSIKIVISFLLFMSVIFFWVLAGEKFTRLVLSIFILISNILIFANAYNYVFKRSFKIILLILLAGSIALMSYLIINYYNALDMFDMNDILYNRTALQGQLAWFVVENYFIEPPLDLFSLLTNEFGYTSSVYGQAGKSLIQKFATPQALYLEVMSTLGTYAGGFPDIFFIYMPIYVIPFAVFLVGIFFGYMNASLVRASLNGKLLIFLVIGYLYYFKVNSLFTSGDIHALTGGISPLLIFIFLVYSQISLWKKSKL